MHYTYTVISERLAQRGIKISPLAVEIIVYIIGIVGGCCALAAMKNAGSV